MKRFLIVLPAAAILLSIGGCGSTGSSTDCSLPVMEWTDSDTVCLDSGLIRGLKDREETWSWKGIPYAAPPVAEKRWKAPEPVEDWKGVRAAYSFGKPAVQFDLVFKESVRGSEDCLFLNVWRPQGSERNLPVYVWIHGGGNSSGRSDIEDYHGYAFASRNNAVFVSINYRLGPFGWFRHPSLFSGDELDDSGNYGLLDIIAALRWIQTNIYSFGGDPGNVTVAGESAGANNILALMMSPEAGGLFHKAVVQSGYRRQVSTVKMEKHCSELIDYLLQQSAFASGNLSPEQVKGLLYSAGADTILGFYKGGIGGMTDNLYHVMDGRVFPVDGYDGLMRGEPINPVPLIIGTNLEETKLFLFFDQSLDRDSEFYDAVAEAGSLNFKLYGADSIAESLTSGENNPPVWVYRFDWGAADEDGNSPLPAPYGKHLGAFHTLEIPFFLGTDFINGPLFTGFLFNAGNRAGRKALSTEIMTYTGNFLRSGSPNSGLETFREWPQWSEEHQYMVFNAEGEEAALTVENRLNSRSDIMKRLKSRLGDSDYRLAVEYLMR